MEDDNFLEDTNSDNPLPNNPDPIEPADPSPNHPVERRSQSSSSESGVVSDLSGSANAESSKILEDSLNLSGAAGCSSDEQSTCPRTFNVLPDIVPEEDVSRTVQRASLGDAKNLFMLNFHDGSQVKSMDDQDKDTDEVFMRNPTRVISSEDESSNDVTFPKPGFSTSTDDDSTDYIVCAPEGEMSEIKTKGLSHRYSKNLQKFLKDTKILNKPTTLSKRIKKLNNRKSVYKKLFKSEGALSDILKNCGAITKVPSAAHTLQLGRISKSAPASFSDQSVNSEELIFEEMDSETNAENSDFKLKHFRLPSKAINVESRLDMKEKLEPDKKKVSTLIEIHESPEKSLQEINTASAVFKVPVIPEHSPKSCSPTDTKINPNDPKPSPSSSPRRPSDFNISPRQAVYTFCPSSPTGLVRQCRSLPNISHAPKKHFKRASLTLENLIADRSVKALFTDETPSATPRPSAVNIESLRSQSGSLTSAEKPKLSLLNVNPSSESSESNASESSSKFKSRRKLDFSSGAYERSNANQTLQDSSSSMDITADVSKLDIKGLDIIPSVELTLIESPPKKKRSHDSSGLSSTKKPCVSQEAKVDEDKESVADKGSLMEGIEQSTSTDQGASVLTPIPPEKIEGSSESARGGGSGLIATSPIVRPPEEMDSDFKPKRTLKRTKVRFEDDVAEDPSDPKRKKQD